jgi:hypothetical protein
LRATVPRWQGMSGGVRYVWDAENRLRAVIPAIPVAGQDRKVEYGYDYLGRRVIRRTYDWDGQALAWTGPVEVTKYVYNGWRVIMELDGLAGDIPTRKFSWGLDLAAQAGQVNSLESAGGIGGLLAAEDSAGTGTKEFIYFADANGNIGQVVETTAGASYGTVAAHYEYAPFGKRINTASPTEYDQPYRFSSKPFDSETEPGLLGLSPLQPRTRQMDQPGSDRGTRWGLICTLTSANSTPQIVDPLGQVQYGYIYPGEDPAQVVRSWQQELAFPSLQEINRRLSNMRINDCERNQYGRIRKSALRACRCAHSLAQFFADPSLVERAAKENQNEYVLSDWYISLKTEGFVEPEWTNEGEALAKIFRSIAIRCGRKNLVFECECECDREGGDEAYAWTRPRIGGAIHLCPLWLEDRKKGWGTFLHEMSHHLHTVDEGDSRSANAHHLESVATELCDLAQEYVDKQ